MIRVEVKNKLRRIIIDMMLNCETEQDVPEAVVNQILQNYGCTVNCKSNTQEDFNLFLKNLQKCVEKTCSIDESTVKEEEYYCEMSLLEKYIETETEYNEVTSDLLKTLEEVIKHKEAYSEYFKDECKTKNTAMEVLNKKCQFLKLQFFIKLYGEEQAYKGHLILRDKLRKELSTLKKSYNEVVDYNTKMDEIRNDKTFIELFKVYKELKRIEQMNEIIGTI